MMDLIDKTYFRELSERDPQDICRRALCEYDDVNNVYSLTVWNEAYRIYPNLSKIDRMASNTNGFHDYFYLFIIYYLLTSKEIEISGDWISEKDIPGGPTFFRGPHEIPTNVISGRFDNNIDEFKQRCDQLHGRPLKMADAAYGFQMAPRIPVAVLYWRGDEVFSAQSKILYDRSVAEQLAPDIVYALAVGICERLGKPSG